MKSVSLEGSRRNRVAITAPSLEEFRLLSDYDIRANEEAVAALGSKQFWIWLARGRPANN
jgi:hypothetical protein